MQFECALGLTPTRPVKEIQAQFDRRAVQGEQAIFESKLLLGTDRLALAQEIIEEPLIKFPRSMRIGISQRGALGLAQQTQMSELTFATLQAIGDFTQRTGVRQLTKEHGPVSYTH